TGCCLRASPRGLGPRPGRSSAILSRAGSAPHDTPGQPERRGRHRPRDSRHPPAAAFRQSVAAATQATYRDPGAAAGRGSDDQTWANKDVPGSYLIVGLAAADRRCASTADTLAAATDTGAWFRAAGASTAENTARAGANA